MRLIIHQIPTWKNLGKKKDATLGSILSMGLETMN